MSRTASVAEYLYNAGWRLHGSVWTGTGTWADPRTGDRYELREALTLQHARDARALLLEHPTDRAPRIVGRGRA